jgi:hypothetical protein
MEMWCKVLYEISLAAVRLFDPLFSFRDKQALQSPSINARPIVLSLGRSWLSGDLRRTIQNALLGFSFSDSLVPLSHSI